jgi:antitoxin component YwqK of YwqJK toxin-antitoxin module
MKILIWVLNIIQFIIVYFLVFSLFFTGVLDAIDPSIGLSGETFWPLMSMGIAGVPWKYYNRFSLFITSKRLKAPAEEVVAEEASKSTLYKEKIIKKETYKQEMTNKDVKKNRTKFLSILKKILFILFLFYLSLMAHSYYKNTAKTNPESEYFMFYEPQNNNLTVEVKDIRYLKKDMSLFSGVLTGFIIRSGSKYQNLVKNGYYYSGTFEFTTYYHVNYLNGKKDGKVYYWRTDAPWLFDGDYAKGWAVKAFFKNGKAEGPYETWHDNGQIKLKSHYKNGKKEGLNEEWDNQGQLIVRSNYKKNLLQGDLKQWDKNGNLIKHWIMKDDILIEKIVN